MIEIIQPILLAAFSGLVYGYYAYKNQVLDPTKPTPIRDNWQLVATCVLGGFVGVGLYASGLPVNDVNMGLQFAAYGFLTVIIERGLKTVCRIVNDKYPWIADYFSEETKW